MFAVRQDWHDHTHDFVGPADTLTAAAELWAAEHLRWRRAPWRPRLSVVLISHSGFWLHVQHRTECRAPDCPSTGIPA